MLDAEIAGHIRRQKRSEPMTTVRHAGRAYPPVAIHQVVAFAAALLVAGIVALAALGPLNLQLPSADGPGVRPAVLEAARQWEIQRKAESGYVDPVIRSGQEWEQQRRQQSPIE
jgi:hypothetical protein